MTPTVINERPRGRAKCFTVFPSDEIADFQANTAEEIGVVMQMRWYAWHNGGIENTPENLQRLRRKLGISGQKFRKLWPYLSHFFVENSGFLYYSPDERRRQEAEQRSAKLQEAGKKGAESRWESRRVVPKTDDGQAMFENMPSSSYPILATNTETSSSACSVVELSQAVSDDAAQDPEPHPPRKPPEVEASTSFPNTMKLITSCKRFADVTPKFLNQLVQAARGVDPGIDDERLCIAIKETFKGDKQESPGLWLYSVPAWLSNQKTATA